MEKSQTLLDVSLKLSPSVHFQQAPCRMLPESTAFSLWPVTEWICPLSVSQEAMGVQLISAVLWGLSGAWSCVWSLLLWGWRVQGQESCLLHPICRLLVSDTHGSCAGKPLFTGDKALKTGLVKDQHQRILRRCVFSVVTY